jgi:hypothetical protein
MLIRQFRTGCYAINFRQCGLSKWLVFSKDVEGFEWLMKNQIRTRWMRLSRGRLNRFTHHLRLHHARMARGTSNCLSGHVTDRIMFYLHHFEKELPEVRIRFGGSGEACAHLALRDMIRILRQTKRLSQKLITSEDSLDAAECLQRIL